MRYLLSFMLLAGLCLTAYAQEQSNDSIPYEIRKQAYIYTIANKYNDPSVARMALYNLIADNPGSPQLLDTLALIYLDYQQYASAALVAQDAIRLNPDDMFATEIAAVAFENLGVKNRALTHYEKLYLADNDLSVLYKVCFLQLDLKRYSEALTNAEVIENSPDAEKMMLMFPTADQKGQQVNMKIGALRLKAMLAEDQGQKEEAKALYQKVLVLKPDFELVKNQLKALEEGK